MNLLNESFRENVCTLYVLHIRDSGKLLSTQFVKVDKASSPATGSQTAVIRNAGNDSNPPAIKCNDLSCQIGGRSCEHIDCLCSLQWSTHAIRRDFIL